MSVTFRVKGSEIFLNVANDNAGVILAAAGLEVDSCGSLTVAQARMAAGRLFMEANSFSRETVEETGDGGCRVISCGLAPERVEIYAVALARLVRECERLEVLEIHYA